MDVKKIFHPILCLTLIAVVVASLLMLTNSMTAERIHQMTVKARQAAKKEILPEADSFIEKNMTIGEEEVLFYMANNGVGYIFGTSSLGYGGLMDLMVGINSEGKISGISIISQNETPGLGTRATESVFLNQYQIIVPEVKFIVTRSKATYDFEIEALSGATITSAAVTEAVNEAISVYQAVKGEVD